MKQEYNNHKDWKRGWPYKEDSPYDLEWQEDRRKLFAESGNGWWYFLGTKYLRIHMDKIRKERENERVLRGK